MSKCPSCNLEDGRHSDSCAVTLAVFCGDSSPRLGKPNPRLPVVNGVKCCRKHGLPLAVWSNGRCIECNRERNRAARGKR